MLKEGVEETSVVRRACVYIMLDSLLNNSETIGRLYVRHQRGEWIIIGIVEEIVSARTSV